MKTKKNKYGFLLKNIGLLTISNFGSKILSFLLIPLYTSYLSTESYGVYDIYYSTISLLIPILSLNIVEGVMRFSLDKEKDKRDIFSIGLNRVVLASLIVCFLILINVKLQIIPIFVDYAWYFIVLFFGTLVYDLMSQFSRGLEKIKEVAIAGAINSITMLTLNVLFLVKFKMGLNGYFLANCISFIIPTIYYSFKLRINEYLILKRNNNLEKEIYDYSKPLVFNTLAWWVNNVSDRYVVTMICGIAANGIYSVAYKIPSLLNVFQSIFSQAWTLSAVKEFDKENTSFYTNVYNIYNSGLIITCSFLILFDKLMAKILFANDFYAAWKYAPFLMISVIFGAMSGFLGGIFSAAKKSKIFAKTTIIGASANIILNISLVFLFGPIGAAIATLISYFLVWISRVHEVNKILPLGINIRQDLLLYSMLTIQAMVLLISHKYTSLAINMIIFCLIIFIKKQDIVLLLQSIKKKITGGIKT